MTADRPIRVLHLLKGLDAGGAERLVLDLCAVSTRASVAPSAAGILAAHRALVPAFEAEGIPVHELGARGDLDLAWMVRLRRILLAEQPDVLHLHLPYPAVLGRLVARSLPGSRRPVVVHTRHNLWTATHPLLRAGERATAHLDDASLVVATSAWAALPRQLRRNTEILPHGIRRPRPGPGSDPDPDRSEVPDPARHPDRSEVPDRDRAPDPDPAAGREAVRAELGVADDETLVLSLANLRVEKGYDVLLPAAATLVAEGLPLRFVAAGDGPLAGVLARKRDGLGLGDHFRFLGYRDDVPRLLGAADVLVLASHHESSPVAVMEALAAGVPVVSTCVGDVPAQVRDGVEGRLVPPGDAAALAAALRSLVLDPEARRTMAAAAAQAGTQFDIELAARRLERLYAGLVAARRPADPG